MLGDSLVSPHPEIGVPDDRDQQSDFRFQQKTFQINKLD